MKVLKEGIIPDRPDFFLGQEIVCGICSCEFVPDDPLDISPQKRTHYGPSGEKTYLVAYTRCPTCKYLICIDGPEIDDRGRIRGS